MWLAVVAIVVLVVPLLVLQSVVHDKERKAMRGKEPGSVPWAVLLLGGLVLFLVLEWVQSRLYKRIGIGARSASFRRR